MAEPHNYRTVGYSMIMISAALVAIALLYLAIGEDVLYSDHISREKQMEYKQMVEEAKQVAQGKNLSVDLNEEMNVQNP
jgi:hypothetical protein